MPIVIPAHDQAQHRLWWRTLLASRPDWADAPRYDAATALRVLGIDDIHPSDVIACTYTTRATARLSARANQEAWGHPTLGVVNVEGAGWVSVVDLRPALAALGCPATPSGRSDPRENRTS